MDGVSCYPLLQKIVKTKTPSSMENGLSSLVPDPSLSDVPNNAYYLTE